MISSVFQQISLFSISFLSCSLAFHSCFIPDHWSSNQSCNLSTQIPFLYLEQEKNSIEIQLGGTDRRFSKSLSSTKKPEKQKKVIKGADGILESRKWAFFSSESRIFSVFRNSQLLRYRKFSQFSEEIFFRSIQGFLMRVTFFLRTQPIKQGFAPLFCYFQ